MMKTIFLTLIFLGSICLSASQVFNREIDTDWIVRITDTKALIFKKDMWTTTRKSYQVPQMTCVGGTAYKMHPKVESIQCINMGYDGENVQWKCNTTLNKTLKLGECIVMCEGLRHPYDEYVFEDSCALEFTLDYTDYYYNQQKPVNSSTNHTKINYANLFNTIWMMTAFFLFVFVIIMATFSMRRQPLQHPYDLIPLIEVEDPPVHREPRYIGPQPSYANVVFDNMTDAQTAGYYNRRVVVDNLADAQTAGYVGNNPPQSPQSPQSESTNTYDSDADGPRQRHNEQSKIE
jgi:hypothetical protein